MYGLYLVQLLEVCGHWEFGSLHTRRFGVGVGVGVDACIGRQF